MKKKILAVMVIGITLLCTYIIIGEYEQESKAFKDQSNFTALINTARAERDLEPLQDSEYLKSVAERKCADMVARNYLTHVDPDGKHIYDYTPQGYKYGENLAGGYYSSYQTVQAWLASPEHLENIVDPMFKSVGHATCYNGKQYLNVEVFSSN